MKRTASVLVATSLLSVVLSAQKATVPLFVTSAGAANGFTDPSKDNQDTMKDLRNSLKGRKGIVLTDDRDQAAIVLVVMNRETAQVTSGFLGDPARDRIIRVKFIANGTETEMRTTSNNLNCSGSPSTEPKTNDKSVTNRILREVGTKTHIVCARPTQSMPPHNPIAEASLQACRHATNTFDWRRD